MMKLWVNVNNHRPSRGKQLVWLNLAGFGLVCLMLAGSTLPLPALSVAATAHSQNVALLVGAWQYPSKDMRLEGPGNDVDLMKGLLNQRGFRVTTLGTTGSAAATRANIIASMRHIAEVAQDGDFVFVFFAGHGATELEGAIPGYAARPERQQHILHPTHATRRATAQ